MRLRRNRRKSATCRPGEGMNGVGPGDGRARGWLWLLGAGQLLSWGSLYYPFAMIVGAMHDDLGWSRVQLNGAMACALLVSGVLAPSVGRALQRWGGRLVMSVGGVIGALALGIWAGASSLWMFFVALALLGVAFATTLYEAAFAVVAQDPRVDHRRGVIVVTLLGGLAGTVFLPLVHWGVMTHGWRESLHGLGLLQLVVILPLYAASLPRGPARPDPSGVRSTATGMEAADWRDRRFQGIAVLFVAQGLSFSGFMFHLVPMLQSWRVDAGTLLLTVSLHGPMQVAGRLLVTVLPRQYGLRQLGPLVCAGQAGATLLLLVAPPTTIGLALFATLFGVSSGLTSVVRGTAVAELFGRSNFATINGALGQPVSFAMAAAPFLLACVWSATGEPRVVLLLLFVSAVVSLVGARRATSLNASTSILL